MASPAPRAATYHALLEQEKAAGRFEAHKPFLRGGIWRNFMSRYSEANWMHKRMLGASRRLAALPPGLRTPESCPELTRVPDSPDLLMIWNNSPYDPAFRSHPARPSSLFRPSLRWLRWCPRWCPCR